MSDAEDGDPKRGALDILLRAASARGPDALRARWASDAREGETTIALDLLATHYAARLYEARPLDDSPVLLLGSPEHRTLAAIVGAQRLGLDVTLASPALDEIAIAAVATQSRARILIGPMGFAGLPLSDRIFTAAAASPLVRLVALHGGERSGALGLDAPLEEEPSAMSLSRSPLTWEAVEGEPARRIDALALEVARDLVARAGMRPEDVIVSLVSLASAPGLVAGAFAPLLSGAHVIWQTPFAASVFAEALESAARVHLVAPAAVAPALMSARLLDNYRLASLTWVGDGAMEIPGGRDPTRVFRLEAALRLDDASGETAGREFV